MKRQIQNVEEVMARNAHWNHQGRCVIERLEEADAKLTEAIYIDLRPWYRRIDWKLVAALLYVASIVALFGYYAIRGFEAFARLLEWI